VTSQRFFPIALILAIASTASTPARAQNTVATDSEIVESRDRRTTDTHLEERLARNWELEVEEWTRYRELMQGPLGVYSPGLDPLTALGIEARTDQERRRYAELQARLEARRVEKLLAYQRAYDAAWQRLYPTLQPVVDLTGSDVSVDAVRGVGRLAVFIKDDCLPCEQRVRQLQAAGTTFDLYMVGSRQDDARIRQWAARAGIEPAKVRERVITLNHDAGRWLSIGMQGELPAVVREVDGQWRHW
jgi:integrating conjugative element protein (TIGR03759 family)